MSRRKPPREHSSRTRPLSLSSLGPPGHEAPAWLTCAAHLLASHKHGYPALCRSNKLTLPARPTPGSPAQSPVRLCSSTCRFAAKLRGRYRNFPHSSSPYTRTSQPPPPLEWDSGHARWLCTDAPSSPEAHPLHYAHSCCCTIYGSEEAQNGTGAPESHQRSGSLPADPRCTGDPPAPARQGISPTVNSLPK